MFNAIEPVTEPITSADKRYFSAPRAVLAVKFRTRWCRIARRIVSTNDSKLVAFEESEKKDEALPFFHAHSRYRNLTPINERMFRTNEF